MRRPPHCRRLSRSHTCGSGGFTLLEVLIATSIAAIGIVSLLQLFSGSARLVGSAAEQTEAVVVARSIMDAALWQSDLDDTDESQGAFGNYRWQIEILDYEPQLGGIAEKEQELENVSDDYELKEIVVTVYWETPGGVARSIVMNSARLMEQF